MKRYFPHFFSYLIATIACVYSSGQGAEAPRNGYFFSVGGGFSPYARTSEAEYELSSRRSGLAITIVAGYLWARRHSVELRSAEIFLDGSPRKTQGVVAVSYTHYFRVRGPAPLLSFGYGFQHGPALGAGTGAESVRGAAAFFAAGLRLSRRSEVALEYSFGATSRNRFDGLGFDYHHRQLIFVGRVALFGK